MSRSSAGLLLIAGGCLLVLIGGVLWSGGLAWFGRLPGDIRVVRGHARVYVPITSMILVSVVLSIVAAIIRRLR